MTQPTEPIEFSVAADELVDRFPGHNEVSSEILEKLHTICTTTAAANSTTEHGRDWWPLAMHWALDGKTPRAPGAV